MRGCSTARRPGVKAITSIAASNDPRLDRRLEPLLVVSIDDEGLDALRGASAVTPRLTHVTSWPFSSRRRTMLVLMLPVPPTTTTFIGSRGPALIHAAIASIVRIAAGSAGSLMCPWSAPGSRCSATSTPASSSSAANASPEGRRSSCSHTTTSVGGKPSPRAEPGERVAGRPAPRPSPRSSATSWPCGDAGSNSNRGLGAVRMQRRVDEHQAGRQRLAGIAQSRRPHRR